jgi:hypothetical protein
VNFHLSRPLQNLALIIPRPKRFLGSSRTGKLLLIMILFVMFVIGSRNIPKLNKGPHTELLPIKEQKKLRTRVLNGA